MGPPLWPQPGHCLGTGPVPWSQGLGGGAKVKPACSDPGLLGCHLGNAFGSQWHLAKGVAGRGGCRARV